MARTIIGVLGPGETARPLDCQRARDLGALIAAQSWVLLTGGRPAGVMAAAQAGAQAAGGLTLGILPGDDPAAADPAVDLVLCTALGQGRNNVNVLSAQVVIACGMGFGTASEVALALKQGRPVVLLDERWEAYHFFQGLGAQRLVAVTTATAAIAQTHQWLAAR